MIDWVLLAPMVKFIVWYCIYTGQNIRRAWYLGGKWFNALETYGKTMYKVGFSTNASQPTPGF